MLLVMVDWRDVKRGQRKCEIRMAVKYLLQDDDEDTEDSVWLTKAAARREFMGLEGDLGSQMLLLYVLRRDKGILTVDVWMVRVFY